MQLETIRMALEALIANKIRTFLSMLGIIIGVSTVIVVVGIGLGSQAKIAEQFKNLSVESIVVMANQTSRTSTSKIDESDVKFLLENSKFLKNATAILQQRIQVATGKSSGSYTIIGSSSTFFDISNLKIDQGRGFNTEEEEKRSAVAVIGSGIVTEFFDGNAQSAIGQSINVGKKKMTIVGTLKTNGSQGMISYDDSVYIPFSVARNGVMGGRTRVMLMLLAKDVNALPFAMDEVETLLRAKHKIKEGREADFRLRDAGSMVSSAQDSSKTMTILLTGVATIVLIVSGIGIMNVMFVIVAERTKEIGIMKAIGAKQRDILLQFLLEAVILSLVGGLIGIGLGEIIIPLLNKLEGWKVLSSVSGKALAFTFSVFVGIFFGFYPALKASRLDPVDALRSE